MEMEEMEGKRPRFLWIIVVAVVAAALTIFILVQSGRMSSRVAEGESTPSEEASGPGETGWPAPETALSEERVPQTEPIAKLYGEQAPVSVLEETSEPVTASKPVPTVTERPKLPAEKRTVRRDSGTSAVPTTETGRYVVQVGSFKDQAVARIQADKMEQYGYRAWVESADVPGKGRYYRVRVGGFEDVADAGRVAQSLSEKLGVSCWVDNR